MVTELISFRELSLAFSLSLSLSLSLTLTFSIASDLAELPTNSRHGQPTPSFLTPSLSSCIRFGVVGYSQLLPSWCILSQCGMERERERERDIHHSFARFCSLFSSFYIDTLFSLSSFFFCFEFRKLRVCCSQLEYLSLSLSLSLSEYKTKKDLRVGPTFLVRPSLLHGFLSLYTSISLDTSL